MELAEKYNIPVTYLFGYDAILDPRYKEKLSQCHNYELGGWFEVLRPLADKAGVEWLGEDGVVWDYENCNVSFSAGYTPEQRQKLVDVYMDDFKTTFGYYPKAVGSWIIDAYTLNYMHEKYGVIASCNCRDQWGTDGISIWGGYYSHGYYPSKNNVLCPAGNKENQIDVPVFRMLGSCPVHQYDMGLDIEKGPSENMGVVTLEPVYKNRDIGGGGVPEWVDWFLGENFRKETLNFNYVHVGQENTMGWKNQEIGTLDQFDKIIARVEKGEIELQTLSQTAALYRHCYELTPATSLTALDDWKNNDTPSLWYNCKNYRLNFYKESGIFRIRDIYIFRDDYPERYRYERCTTRGILFDNLPFIDGNRWSGNHIRAGIYPEIQDSAGDYQPLSGKCTVDFNEPEEYISVSDGDIRFKLTLSPDEIKIDCNKSFRLVFKSVDEIDAVRLIGNKLNRTHRDFDYSLTLNNGSFKPDGKGVIYSENGIINIGCLPDKQ